MICRSRWPHRLRRGSAAACLLGLWVRIPPAEWMSVSCECCVLSGRGLCVGLITRPEESYRLWCVSECDRQASIMRRPWPTGAVAPLQKKRIILTYNSQMTQGKFYVNFGNSTSNVWTAWWRPSVSETWRSDINKIWFLPICERVLRCFNIDGLFEFPVWQKGDNKIYKLNRIL
jgi:hypothetical protein